jgi:3',5'-cyclic AMP phosphodiesterase CpdA
MTRILHISDLHFGREQPALVVGLEQAIGELAPDLIVASGDLTQRARRHELEAAASFLGRLPAPVLTVPGNHDLPGITLKRFFDPWRRWRAYFPAGLEPRLETAAYIAVGANSARPWGPSLDWSRGRLSEDQIRRIRHRLQPKLNSRLEPELESSGASQHGLAPLRILAAHHPLLLTEAGRHRGLMRRSPLALSRLAMAGLDLALGGHVHLGYAGVVEGVVVAHAGTAISDRLVGEANGFNLIEGDRASLAVQHWAWSSKTFRPDRVSSFRRGEGGWQPA